MAKIYLTKIDRQGKNLEALLESGELVKGKMRITGDKDDYPESIWVAKDEKNKVMYLMNHALMFYPFPSWGMELPLKDNLNILPYRGNTFHDLNMTLLPEAYEHIKKYVDKEDNFDFEKYLTDLKEQANKEENGKD